MHDRWSRFCTVNCQPSVGNYMLSHVGLGQGFEPLTPEVGEVTNWSTKSPISLLLKITEYCSHNCQNANPSYRVLFSFNSQFQTKKES